MGGRRIGMKGLNRIDEHAGGPPGAPADDLERRLMEVLERETVVEVALATQSGLHAVPPSVVGPRKTHDELPAGIEAGQAHRRHDPLGSPHVKPDPVEAPHPFLAWPGTGDDTAPPQKVSGLTAGSSCLIGTQEALA